MNNKKKKIKIFKLLLFITFIIITIVSIFIYSTFKKIEKNINDMGIKPIENGDIGKNPLAILLLGEGTNANDGESGVDAISLLLINPNKKVARIIGVPRDSYLPTITKDKLGPYDKITNSGENIANIKKILEHTFNININYFASMNFVSFVNIIDSIGGIEMDVPDLREAFMKWSGNEGDGTFITNNSPLKDGTKWCEHDSQRNPYKVCFDKFGKQLLDGEHALALARTRHYDSDFSRNNRQMEMIKSIANKITKEFNIKNIVSLVDAVSKNIKTNIHTDKFISFFMLGQQMSNKSGNFTIETFQLDGESSIFKGELSGLASYNKVSIYSIELLREKCKEILKENYPIKIDTKPFYFDINKTEYSSKYKDYKSPGLLEDSMDIEKLNNNEDL